MFHVICNNKKVCVDKHLACSEICRCDSVGSADLQKDRFGIDFDHKEFPALTRYIAAASASASDSSAKSGSGCKGALDQSKT